MPGRGWRRVDCRAASADLPHTGPRALGLAPRAPGPAVPTIAQGEGKVKAACDASVVPTLGPDEATTSRLPARVKTKLRLLASGRSRDFSASVRVWAVDAAAKRGAGSGSLPAEGLSPGRL